MPQTSVDFDPPIAMEGQLETSSPHDVESCVSDEATGIPVGRAVVLKAGATSEVDLPAATGESAAAFGISLRDPMQPPDANGEMVFADGDGVAVCWSGNVWVQVEDAVTKGAQVFVRFSAGATLTELGRFRSNDGNEGGGALASARTGWTYGDSAAAGGYARVKVVK